MPPFNGPVLNQNLLHHTPVNIRQPKMATLVFVGEPGMVDAQAAQNGRLQIVDVHGVPRDVVAVVVGFAEREPRFHAAARQPDREASRMMVPAVIGGGQAARVGHAKSGGDSTPTSLGSGTHACFVNPRTL